MFRPGVCDIGCSFDFRQTYASFCKGSLRIRPEVVLALLEIQQESAIVATKSVYRGTYSDLPSRSGKAEVQTPQRFLELETKYIGEMSYLSQKYVPNVRGIVYKHLNSVEQKWFNLYETDGNRYAASRLRCFLNEIDLRLADTLHALGVRSIKQFADLIRAYMPSSCAVKSLKNITTVRANGETVVKGAMFHDETLTSGGACYSQMNCEEPRKGCIFKLAVILALERRAPTAATERAQSSWQKATARVTAVRRITSRSMSKQFGPSGAAAKAGAGGGPRRSGSKTSILDQAGGGRRASAGGADELGASVSKDKPVRRKGSFELDVTVVQGKVATVESEAPPSTEGGAEDGGDGGPVQLTPYAFDVKPQSIVDMMGYLFDKGRGPKCSSQLAFLSFCGSFWGIWIWTIVKGRDLGCLCCGGSSSAYKRRIVASHGIVDPFWKSS